jgi:hypothetical protein
MQPRLVWDALHDAADRGAQARLYVLDANIFIEAKQRYYAFDVCPGFWDALVWHHANGSIISVDRVKAELEVHQDELTNWACADALSLCFVSTDVEAVVSAYGDAVTWVMAQDFTDEAKAQFADQKEADAWVIAYAKANWATVVTHEKPVKDIKRRVPIPNVCLSRTSARPCASRTSIHSTCSESWAHNSRGSNPVSYLTLRCAVSLLSRIRDVHPNLADCPDRRSLAVPQFSKVVANDPNRC